MKKQTEQERLGISDETMKEIKQYLLETSLPRLIKEHKEKTGKLERVLYLRRESDND